MTKKFISKQGTTIRDLIEVGFSLDKPIHLQDPDTDWILIPWFYEDDNSIAIMSDYGSKWKDETP